MLAAAWKVSTPLAALAGHRYLLVVSKNGAGPTCLEHGLNLSIDK